MPIKAINSHHARTGDVARGGGVGVSSVREGAGNSATRSTHSTRTGSKAARRVSRGIHKAPKLAGLPCDASPLHDSGPIETRARSRAPFSHEPRASVPSASGESASSCLHSGHVAWGLSSARDASTAARACRDSRSAAALAHCEAETSSAAGGFTPLASAHTSRSCGVWQQQAVQHSSAEPHPQAQFSHG